jgi:hypothetical protein
MNTYEVTIRIPNKEAFIDFIERVGPAAGEMTVTVTKVIKDLPISEKSPYHKAVAKPQKVRTSRVNDAILAALHNSTLTIKQLKEALEHANLSAGSLSTGIAALTKSKQIERVGEGLYALAGYQQAAE